MSLPEAKSASGRLKIPTGKPKGEKTYQILLAKYSLCKVNRCRSSLYCNLDVGRSVKQEDEVGGINLSTAPTDWRLCVLISS